MHTDALKVGHHKLPSEPEDMYWQGLYLRMARNCGHGATEYSLMKSIIQAILHQCRELLAPFAGKDTNLEVLVAALTRPDRIPQHDGYAHIFFNNTGKGRVLCCRGILLLACLQFSAEY